MTQLVFFLFGCLVLVSCRTTTLTNTEIPKEESEKFENDFLKHRRWIYDCFKRYIEYSDFLDENSRVSAESVEKFKDLFLNNATVWNDYIWEPRMVYATDYADKVYYLHRIKGLKVEYEEDVLEKLYASGKDDLLIKIDRADPDQYVYKYHFQTRKGIYYILNKEQQVIYYDEPLYYELEFIFHISPEEQMAKIMDIMPVKKERNN